MRKSDGSFEHGPLSDGRDRDRMYNTHNYLGSHVRACPNLDEIESEPDCNTKGQQFAELRRRRGVTRLVR